MIPRVQIRGFVRWVGAAALCGLLLGGTYLGTLQLTGNFNTVVAGEFYRSGQLSAAQIVNYTKQYGIKTIINLRGNNAGSAWYDREVSEAKRDNIAHIDFGISARRELTAEEAAHLIAIMTDAAKPILIHCQAGADRSGLASALYLAAVKKVDQVTAARQLSIRYGHFSLPFIAEYAMDRTFEAFESSLNLQHPSNANAPALQINQTQHDRR